MKAQEQKQRRKKGEGSVYQLSDGRWGAAVSYDDDGQTRRKVITDKTMEGVKAKMHDWLVNNHLIEGDGQQEMVITSDSLVHDLVEEYKSVSLIGKIAQQELSVRTYDTYEYALGLFAKEFEGRTIGSITSTSLSRYFIKLCTVKHSGGEVYAQSTLNKVYNNINDMFIRAVEKNYISKNPMEDKDVLHPKSRKAEKVVKPYTDTDIEGLRKALSSDLTYATPVELLVNSGMRIQEALALRWGNIDLEEGSISITNAFTITRELDENGSLSTKRYTELAKTKTEKSARMVYVGEDMVQLLKDWKEFASGSHCWSGHKEQHPNTMTKFGANDFVFGNSKSASWTVSGFRASVNKHLKKHNSPIEKLEFHRIRHYAGTIMGDSGATMIEIMKQLGHTQGSTTMRYIGDSINTNRRTGDMLSLKARQLRGENELLHQDKLRD